MLTPPLPWENVSSCTDDGVSPAASEARNHSNVLICKIISSFVVEVRLCASNFHETHYGRDSSCTFMNGATNGRDIGNYGLGKCSEETKVSPKGSCAII
jgi:hypothetical protein